MERVTDNHTEYLFFKVISNHGLRTHILSFHTLGWSVESCYPLMKCIEKGFTESFINRFDTDSISDYTTAISLAIKYARIDILDHIYKERFGYYRYWMYWIFIEIVINGNKDTVRWYFEHKVRS